MPGHIVTMPSFGTFSARTMTVSAGSQLQGAGRSLTMYGDFEVSGLVVSLALEFVVNATMSTPGTTSSA